MKDDIRRLLKAGLIVAAVALCCLGAVWLLDQVFNGVFKEWFYDRFVVSTRISPSEKIGILFVGWPTIKMFFTRVLVAVLAAFLFGAGISAYLYAGHQRRREIAGITAALDAGMESDRVDLVLPKAYSEVEARLIRTKAMSQRQQRLVQTEMQRKNDLITYLAHDLKTPLASVIGYLCLLDEVPDMPAEHKVKYTGIALQKAYRLEALIDEFFEITRFNLQSIVLNKGKIRLAFMLQQMADEFYPMLAPQGKQAAIYVPEDLILVADADKLARVFNNILKNAITYSRQDSVIEISAAQQGPSIVINFTNQGDPIPAHKLDTIFEKFYRVDSARATNTGGAGLGMAIAKEIVTAHGGTIRADSNLECTTFTVELPA